MNLEESRALLASAVRKLDARLEKLVDALSHQAPWVELQESGVGESAVRRACEALAAIDYGMDDEVNQSVVCLGAIGVSPDIMECVNRVNGAKHELKRLCSALRGPRVRVPVKGESGPTKAIPVIRVLLRSIQRSELNLLAAYRKIPVLGASPSTITYTVARTRAVYRKSIEQVEVMLAHRDHPGAGRDRAKVAALPRRETHLALAKSRYTNIRANVLYVRLDARGRGRAQFAAELPLMFVMRRKDAVPVVTFPAPQAEPASPRPRYRIIEEAPFLESLPIHRYMAPPRRA
jgi:hypothetical protein